MIDLASYRDLKEQFEVLRNEVLKFSNKLSSSRFAIALTRSDVVSKEQADILIQDFLKLLNLTPTKEDEFEFDQDISYYIQKTSDETLGYERQKPYFVTTISSATHNNIKALKYALFNLINSDKNR